MESKTFAHTDLALQCSGKGLGAPSHLHEEAELTSMDLSFCHSCCQGSLKGQEICPLSDFLSAFPQLSLYTRSTQHSRVMTHSRVFLNTYTSDNKKPRPSPSDVSHRNGFKDLWSFNSVLQTGQSLQRGWPSPITARCSRAQNCPSAVCFSVLAQFNSWFLHFSKDFQIRETNKLSLLPHHPKKLTARKWCLALTFLERPSEATHHVWGLLGCLFVCRSASIICSVNTVMQTYQWSDSVPMEWENLHLPPIQNCRLGEEEIAEYLWEAKIFVQCSFQLHCEGAQQPGWVSCYPMAQCCFSVVKYSRTNTSPHMGVSETLHQDFPLSPDNPSSPTWPQQFHLHLEQKILKWKLVQGGETLPDSNQNKSLFCILISLLIESVLAVQGGISTVDAANLSLTN